MFDYFKQAIDHAQHGIGEFKYQSKRQHEQRRREKECSGEMWCNCLECAQNRKKYKY